MRRAWIQHTPALASFAVMMLIAAGMAISLDPYRVEALGYSAQPARSIELPGPGEDGDLDGYADDVDLWPGDAMLRIAFTQLTLDDAGVRPYLLVGTQDDHARHGAGRELEWPHIVDADPIGMNPGSPEWLTHALRTGQWLRSPANDGHALSDGVVTNETDGWPWVAWLNVREDAANVGFTIEIWDERFGPDERLLTQRFEIPFLAANQSGPAVAHQLLMADAGVVLHLSAQIQSNVDANASQVIAKRWAPTIHFDSGESIFPTDPALMEQFHGFAARDANYETWSRSFNNGRDQYRLLVADFDGNQRTDHVDVQLLWDILRAGSSSDRVHYQVRMADHDAVVVQYWFVYPYNFVIGEDGQDVPQLAHAGDREFIQLTFENLADALNGEPASVSFSQHYHGIRIDNPDLDAAPFVDGRLQVYPARGSHASYPVSGDDSRVRNAFAGYGDFFDGEGPTWMPGEYNLTRMDAQPWHAGYNWGPLTRFHRELGSAGKPLLAHSFVYPWHEPVTWAQTLKEVQQDELAELYGEP